jgi:hypothetical protein
MFIINPFRYAATGYTIENAAVFDGSTDYLSRTPAVAGNKKTWTMSMWVKEGFNHQSTSPTPTLFGAGDGSAKRMLARIPSGAGTVDMDLTFGILESSTWYENNTQASLADPTAWYHLVFVYDSYNGTAADRKRIYINGVRHTDFSN